MGRSRSRWLRTLNPVGDLTMGMRTPWDLYNEEGRNPASSAGPAYTPPPPATARPLPVLPNVRKDSGETRGATSSAENTNGAKQTIQQWADEPAMRSENAAISRLPQVQEQARSLALNRSLMAASMGQRQTPDLATPLANLSDYVSTGQLGNRKPQGLTMQDHAKDIREWAKQNQDDQRDLSKTILSGASAYKSGQIQDTYSQLLKNQLSAENKDPAAKTGNPVVDYNKWITSVDRDPIIKKTPTMLSVLGKARHMLEGNTPVDASNFRYELLQGLGVPRITNYELAGEQGTKDFWGLLDQKLETLKTGTLSDQNKKDYLQLIDGISSGHRELYDQARNFHIQRGINGYDIAPQKALYGVNSMEPATALGKVPTGRPEAPKKVTPPSKVKGDPGMDAFLQSQGN